MGRRRLGICDVMLQNESSLYVVTCYTTLITLIIEYDENDKHDNIIK